MPEHNPYQPDLATQKADLAHWDNEFMRDSGEVSTEANDEAITDDLADKRNVEPEWARAAQDVSEAAAREKIADIHAQMGEQQAALDTQIAAENPEDVLASNAVAQLKRNIAEGPGQKRLIDAGVDDDIHRQVVDKVFNGLGLDSPLPELTADNRNWLRKLVRPKNRKTVNVRKPFETADGLSGVITATRSYNKVTKQHQFHLNGGNG